MNKMSVYSVPVIIGVDEKRIAEEIKNDVEHQVINSITKEVKTKCFQEAIIKKIHLIR